MVKDGPIPFERPQSACIPPWHPDPGCEDARTNSRRLIDGFYVVKRGREVGVYTSWKTAQSMIHNYPNKSLKKCPTWDEAVKEWQEDCYLGTLNSHTCVDDDVEVAADTPPVTPTPTPQPSPSKAAPSSKSSRFHPSSRSDSPSPATTKPSSSSASFASSSKRPAASISRYFAVWNEGTEVIEILSTREAAEQAFAAALDIGGEPHLFIVPSLQVIEDAIAERRR
ncbi:hypothetical protein BDZ89DRAFT_1126947 [Hymenopellis radicata]|nr:hypothetical protein BDZ89DRAFT_1126947 [Hymenopellis radicata]